MSNINHDPATDQDLPQILKIATKNRLEGERIDLAGMLDDFKPNVAARVRSCDTYIRLEVHEHKETHEKMRSLVFANYCKVRKFCPQCASKYAREVAADFIGRYVAMQRKRKLEHLSSYRLLFLTLTVKNCPLDQLRVTLREMSKAWNKFVKTKRFQAAVQGGWFRGVEYLGDHTPLGEAHPHFHAILIVTKSYFDDDYIKADEWSQMWRQALRADYDPVVHVEVIKKRLRQVVGDGGKVVERVQSAIDAAVAEVCKYSVAPTAVKQLSKADFRVLYEQTLQGRQFALGGLVKDTPPDPPEQLDPDLWTYLGIEIWQWGQGQYVMTHEYHARQPETASAGDSKE